MGQDAADMIRNSPLFDRRFYLEQNPDVARIQDIDTVEHYLLWGGFEGRNPHALFDSSFYLERNPEVARKRINPLVHFLTEGARYGGLDPHPLFSIRHYVEQDPDMSEFSFNPLLHYLQRGARQGLDPHPLFDTAFYWRQLHGKHSDSNALVHYLTEGAKSGLMPSPHFDGAYYYRRYPDVAEARINPLVHYVRAGQSEGRQARRFHSIADGTSSMENPDFQRALKDLLDATSQPFSHIMVIACLLRGGYERCLANFVRAIAHKAGLENVLVLVTDFEEMTCLDWLPERTRIVNLVALEPSLSYYEKGQLILELVARRKPSVTISMNSPIVLGALDRHIDTWRDEIGSRVVTYLGSYEPFVISNNCGFNDGPLNRLMENLDLIVTDNSRLRDATLALHDEKPSISSKVFACYKCLDEDLHRRLTLQNNSETQPIPHTQQQRRKAENATKKVLWASRLEELKQLDVLAEIALRMPKVQFDVYGRASSETDLSALSVIKNVSLKGEYDDFATIAKKDIAAFVYTSRADGMPHVLLEAGASGLPVIAPDVGGIAELINDNTGWLIRRNSDVAEYVGAIRHVLDNPDASRARAGNLKTLINERHSWQVFLERVEKLDIWESRTMHESSSSKEYTTRYLTPHAQ